MVRERRGTVNIWRKADAVCFDVDSTIIKEEGLDELALFCGKGEEVAALTKSAMGGSVNYRRSLERRLNLIKPSMMILNKFIKVHRFNLSPGIRELVNRLQARGTAVYLVSGGFQCVVQPLAVELSIPRENVYANRLLHDSQGNYTGFDINAPTSDTGGKGKVVTSLKNKYGYKNLVMVGDGATDMEACPPANAFIGFGGNVVREEVKTKSEWYVKSFYELVKALDGQDLDDNV